MLLNTLYNTYMTLYYVFRHNVWTHSTWLSCVWYGSRSRLYQCPFIQYIMLTKDSVTCYFLCTDTLNTELTSKMTAAGFSQSPFNLLFTPGLTQDLMSHGEEEEGGGMEGDNGRYSEGEGEEEEEEEEEGEGEEGGEQLQLEVISDSISQSMEPAPPGWQYSIQPAAGSVANTNQQAPVTVSVSF